MLSIFSGLIKKAVSLGDWKGLRMDKNAPIVWHTFSTDDCLLFVQDFPQSVDVILRLLQILSFSKFMKEQQKYKILHQLSMQGSEDLRLYLGMPFAIGKSRKQIFSYLLN